MTKRDSSKILMYLSFAALSLFAAFCFAEFVVKTSAQSVEIIPVDFSKGDPNYLAVYDALMGVNYEMENVVEFCTEIVTCNGENLITDSYQYVLFHTDYIYFPVNDLNRLRLDIIIWSEVEYTDLTHSLTFLVRDQNGQYYEALFGFVNDLPFMDLIDTETGCTLYSAKLISF